MTGAGSRRLAEESPKPAHGLLPAGRSPLAHLLHALNQPLTGLQCSLELAVSGPRSLEQYVRVLREGLSLTGRMRILVEAVREMADLQQPEGEGSAAEGVEFLHFDALVRDTAADLFPVAESRRVHIELTSDAPLPVQANRRYLAGLMFRLLDSGLSLTQTGNNLRITATEEIHRACLVVSWSRGPLPEYSPFSRPELGLLIAQAGWEQASADWAHTVSEAVETVTIRFPLAAVSGSLKGASK